MIIPSMLADIGLPMVALYLPVAWLAFVPIILIESAYGSLRYQLPFRRAAFAQAAANSLSTLIGIPITWLVFVLLQVFTVPTGTGPAWLLPDTSSATVAAALIVLTVVFYVMSILTEGFVVARFFREERRKMIWRWVIQANAISYVLLLALA